MRYQRVSVVDIFDEFLIQTFQFYNERNNFEALIYYTKIFSKSNGITIYG